MFRLLLTSVWVLTGCVNGTLNADPTGDDDSVGGDDAVDDDDADDDAVDDDSDDDADDDAVDDDAAGDPAAEALVDALELDTFRSNIETLAGFGDRTQGSASYAVAEDWAVSAFQAMGYEVERHSFEYYGSSRDNVFVTKTGITHPDQMYILGAHLDGRGGGGAADDDGSGVSLVLEAARAFAEPGIVTEISIRFVLWNCEETGLNGSSAYVADRAPLQGLQDPETGEIAEPTWLGMIQQDMILFDHGVPAGPDQIPGADVDVEYQAASAEAAESHDLAATLVDRCGAYCADYPAEVGDAMSNTDSYPFRDHTAAVSVRENRRLDEIGNGGNPHWHQPTDVPGTYSDADFLLGFNAVQMVVGTVAELAGASANP